LLSVLAGVTGQVAEETLARALNVRVFGAEQREVRRYNMHSLVVYNLRLRCAAAWGLFHGSSSFIFHTTKAVALMVGGLFHSRSPIY
jgi:ABC-type multidrug transport system fused ATPase/permease subunit